MDTKKHPEETMIIPPSKFETIIIKTNLGTVHIYRAERNDGVQVAHVLCVRVYPFDGDQTVTMVNESFGVIECGKQRYMNLED